MKRDHEATSSNRKLAGQMARSVEANGCRLSALLIAAVIVLATVSSASAVGNYGVPVFDPDDPGIPPTTPITHETLPPPISVISQPNLQAASIAGVNPGSGNVTISTWLHIPEGKAVSLFTVSSTAEYSAIDLCVGQTSLLDDSARQALHFPGGELPKYFQFFRFSVDGNLFELRPRSQYVFLDLPTLVVDGVEWVHFAASWSGRWWQPYDETTVTSQSTLPPFIDPDYTAESQVIPTVQISGDTFSGAHIGHFATYPDILAPNVVAQLGAINPFGVPEPSSISVMWLLLSAMFYRRRQRSGAITA